MPEHAEDQLVLDLLRQVGRLEESKLAETICWWQTEGEEDERLLAFLLRQQILSPQAKAIVDLIGHGFLSIDSVVTFPTPAGRLKLMEALTAFAASAPAPAPSPAAPPPPTAPVLPPPPAAPAAAPADAPPAAPAGRAALLKPLPPPPPRPVENAAAELKPPGAKALEDNMPSGIQAIETSFSRAALEAELDEAREWLGEEEKWRSQVMDQLKRLAEEDARKWLREEPGVAERQRRPPPAQFPAATRPNAKPAPPAAVAAPRSDEGLSPEEKARQEQEKRLTELRREVEQAREWLTLEKLRKQHGQEVAPKEVYEDTHQESDEQIERWQEETETRRKQALEEEARVQLEMARGGVRQPQFGEEILSVEAEEARRWLVHDAPEEDELLPGQAEVRLPHVGMTLGKCLLTHELAAGSTCAVYTALHQSLNITVAVKVFTAFAKFGAGRARRMFREEAQTIARLNNPHIVRIYDFEEGELPYIVMEYVDGLSVQDLIHRSGFIAPGQAMQLVLQVGQALAFAHSKGVIHCDIKPGNILLDKEGNVKLADLGIARIKGALLAQSRGATGVQAFGTPAYAAPEMAGNPLAADPPADIYSLGAVYYHMVTGQPPFQAESVEAMLIKHQYSPVVPPRQLRPELDAFSSDLIVRLLSKSPRERPQSVAEIVALLETRVRKQGPADGPRQSFTTRIRSSLGGLFGGKK